ncbi:MAG: virulence-associated protein E [Clostridia bacterium]|nr:virulence-associated protein E [Clostridia bacterium]
MKYDRKITISVGQSRKATVWNRQEMLISELWDRLRVPMRGSETLKDYLSLDKSKQAELKDVGGFVGGILKGPRRKSQNVAGRDLITLDLDNVHPGGTDDIIHRVDALECGYCIYSTRKHQPTAPRLRVILPLDRTVSAEEYEPIARRIAEKIGLDVTDPTTFEACRLMYWPSCCSDSEYVYRVADKPFCVADQVLATYADWHDVSSWPALPGQAAFAKSAVRQGDPLQKTGVVGAFCRLYDVYRAMEEFLPSIYKPAEDSPGRYTYVDGSTSGGAVIYDNGKFLYSHHATDPCSGRLVNSFDMVRLHKFGDADDAAKPDAKVNTLPSYKHMQEFAMAIPEVRGLVVRERAADGADGFSDLGAENWEAELLDITATGAVRSTINNVRVILENDPALKGMFALNLFANRGEVLGPLPWDSRGKRRMWDDNDNNGLYWYLEKQYRLTGNGKIDAALSLHSNEHAFNEVRDYLTGLKGSWDGVPRLDTLFIDYLGAVDSAYVRAVTRKAFTAAVARAMNPGCKFDTMLILSGPQGIGKSTLLDKMSRGWFNDSIRTFEGKEASELLQGVWLVEISELDAFRRTDVSRIKQFLSLRADRYRAAYGRHVKELPRCCVFFGTTNNTEFLQDTTGNRRFWPVDVRGAWNTKDVWKDLDAELDQIWAEAFVRWQAGEPLYLTGAVSEEAKSRQEAHREASSREGVVREFLARQVPEDWNTWSIERRRYFWSGTTPEDVKTIPRDRVCALEIWCESLGGSLKEMRNTDTREINAIIAATPGWVKSDTVIRFGVYGPQRGFVRTEDGETNTKKEP